MLKIKPTLISTKDYKTPIKEIISSSSLAYLISPIRSKRLLIKLVWIIFLIGFLFGSIYYVVLNVLDFLQYDTTTSIYEVNEQEAEFPTVSFCREGDPNFDLKFLYIFFKNEDLKNEWQNHFESYTDSTYGKCYRFNSGKNMSNQTIPIKRTISGLNEGFWLNLYYNSTSDDLSIVIYIHNHTQMPTTIYNKARFIQPGSFNYFNIKRIYDQKLELPYNNCYKNVSKSEYHNQTIIDYLNNEKKREYTQKECLYLCRNLKYKEKNPCNSYILDDLEKDIVDKAELLKNNTINECVQNFYKNNYFESCSTLYCPEECDSFTYEINKDLLMTRSSGNISPNKSLDFFAGFNTYENVSRTFFAIRVYYDDLKYTLIKQQPKIELFGLISNVGGTLGLFLVFSFISLLEIFEVLAELVYIKFDWH
jgi:hypothetical protein